MFLFNIKWSPLRGRMLITTVSPFFFIFYWAICSYAISNEIIKSTVIPFVIINVHTASLATPLL